MSATVELAPCPHGCTDGEVGVEQHPWNVHYVICLNCLAKGPQEETEDAAIAAWNTRASQQPATAGEDVVERAARALWIEIGGDPDLWDGEGRGAVGEWPAYMAEEKQAYRRRVRTVIAALSVAQVVPDGWKLVPAEPTEEMLEAANVADRGMMPWRDQWVAMISAVPASGEEG